MVKKWSGFGRPVLLDLCCGAGGASAGYALAGFEVIGVDVERQPRYPFRFVRADAIAYLSSADLSGVAAVHASPPCERWTRLQAARRRAHLHRDLLTALRPRLEATGLPYAIENVEGAPLRADVVLCGTFFGLGAGGFELRRHRVFELGGGWPVPEGLPTCVHYEPAMPVYGHSPNADFYKRNGGEAPSADVRRAAMGVAWMNRDEMAEAIPPAYTALLGACLRAAMEAPE